MPIAPNIEIEPKKSEVQIATSDYKHSIVTSEKMALEPIIAFIGGSNWTVDWLSQVQNQHESLKPFDVAQQNTYQMYHYIKNMIVKLQGALSPSDDTDSGRMSLTGTLIIPSIPGFIPNQYDAFIADIGEGRAGQFTVTHIQKNTLNRGTVYTIDFKLERLMDRRIEKLIEAKTSHTSFYERDLLILGQNPLLAEQDYHDYKTLNETYLQLVNYWVTKNFSRSFSCLTPPRLSQTEPVFDPYVVRAAMAVIAPDESPRLRNCLQYNTDDFRINEFDSVLDAIIKRDSTKLFSAFRGYKLVDVKNFVASPYQGSIRYSGFNYVLVPNIPNDDPDGDDRLFSALYGDSRDFTNYATKLDDNNLFPTLSKDSYIFSQHFYNGDKDNCKLFELAVYNMIHGKAVNAKLTYRFIEAFYDLPRLEQFYFAIPLFCLIKETIRGLG